LDFIHKKGQIHRDIKPENILINKKGELKITDFGIFKQLDEEGAGLASTYCGTPAYM
jgi:serine/threonine protein kinase